MDVLFISPGNNKAIYQELANNYAAIEPPTWALLLAQSCRSVGYKVGICDVNAEELSAEQVHERILQDNPRLICFVVYGQNVSAGAVSMSGAIYVSNFLKKRNIKIPICYIGSYVQALPVKALEEEPSIDFACTNEGVYALRNLLALDDFSNLENIKGIVWRKDGVVTMNKPGGVVPNDRMDIDLPGYAWDLLPYDKQPLDLYRSPLWHADYDETKRTPYAAIQTSIGCIFACTFCMINVVNRDDNEEVGVAGNYSGMRYWSPEFIIKEFDKLYSLGVRTIKITDEMFFLNKKYYKPLCEMIRDRGYGEQLQMWAYSRIDTVRNPDLLKLVRSAGIKWLALGIESGDKSVRLEVSKGKFEDVDIHKVITQIHDSDIEVMGNYIFGLPGDTIETMQKTLDLSTELCTAGWNAYAAMALPGSNLYKDALDKNLTVPTEYEEFSFLSDKTVALSTESLSYQDIIKFRDRAFIQYHSNIPFLDRIKSKFGSKAVDNINKMLELNLQRNFYEE